MCRPDNICIAVHTHTDRLTLAAKVPAQFFLCLNDIEQHGVINGFSTDNKGNHVGTNSFKFRIYSDSAL